LPGAARPSMLYICTVSTADGTIGHMRPTNVAGYSEHNAMPLHEGKACDAVLRMLEARAGAERRDLRADTPRSPGVEVVCTIGAKRYALEHTSIDSYPEKRLDDVQFMAVMGPLEAELSHKGPLPPGCYCSAAVPLPCLCGAKASRLPAVRDARCTGRARFMWRRSGGISTRSILWTSWRISKLQLSQPSYDV
jgi:hypothetical protein